MRRFVCLLLVLALAAAVSAGAETLQDCHRVTLTKTDTTQQNKSVVRVWTADTALDSVDAELSGITGEMAGRIGPTLEAAGNKTNRNSRLDVEVRYSRTGLTWMSFVIQGRTTYHRDLIGQEVVTRTYDMTTGERILLSDIFDADSEGWAVLAEAVREGCTAYFPDETPPQDALEALCTPEALSQADFSLHGYSLVLHYPADLLYPDHHSMMEIVLYYNEIRPYMNEKAQRETDNLTYYKTCALTFDDGPARTNTTLVLQSLMQTGSVATFFVVGNRIGPYADLVQHEHDSGHAVGVHNWTHGNVNKMSGTRIASIREKCENALIAAIGIPPRYDRVPYGLYPRMVKAKLGWPYIQWSVDTYDWRGRSTKTIVSKVAKQIDDGDIILCHDIKDKTPATAVALCEYLAEHGYILLTVDELMAKDSVLLEPDTVYFRCTDGDTSIKK